MKKTILKPLAAGLLAAAVLLLSACNGDDSGNGAATGPSSGSSFSGTTISFNPDIAFTDATSCTYTNIADPSDFPHPYTTAPATYTYVPNADYTTGTLTITFDDTSIPSVVLDLSNFVHSGTSITGFTARSGGTSYPVTVTGPLTAYTPPSSGGGSSGESRASDIPSSMQGSYTLTFHQSTTPPVTNVPPDGDVATFVIGARSLTRGELVLTDPVFYNGNTLEWIFKEGSVWWAVSQNTSGGLNEINVQGPYSGSSAFYGQYNDQPVTPPSSTPTGNTDTTPGQYSGSITLATNDISGRGPNTPALFPGNTVTFTISPDLLTATTNHSTGTLTFDPAASTSGHNVYTDDSSNPKVTFRINVRLDTGEINGCSLIFDETSGGTAYKTTYVASPVTKVP